MIPAKSLFNWFLCLVQKTDGPWGMTMGCHKVNQVVTPIAAAAPDVVSLLEQISTFPGTGDAASVLANALFAILVTKDHWKLFGFHLA